jgi:hypothetical protein
MVAAGGENGVALCRGRGKLGGICLGVALSVDINVIWLCGGGRRLAYVYEEHRK